MTSVLNILDAIFKRVLAMLMLCLVGSVLWQVVSRYLLGAPSSWTEEVARFLLIWISLLGAAWAFRSGMHLALDILPGKFSGKPAAWLKRITLLLILTFSLAVLVVGGGSLVQLTWELKQYSAVLGIPMAIVYLVIPLSGLMICIYALAALGDERVGSSHSTTTTGD